MTRFVLVVVLALCVLATAAWFLSRGEEGAPTSVPGVESGSQRTEQDGPAPIPPPRSQISEPEREDVLEPTLESAPIRTGIVGIVLDKGGAPVAGAAVEVWFPQQMMMFHEDLGPVVGEALTGADGKFVVALRTGADRALLMAHARGGARVEKDGIVVEEGAITTIPPIRLNPSAGFSGHVRTPDGTPIAGATLLVGHRPENRTMTSSEPDERAVTSGKDGAYLADDLLPGTKDVRVRAAGYANGGEAGILVPAERVLTGVDFVLKPELTISGVVRSTSGEPVAGATVQAYLHDPADDVPEDEDEEEEESEEDDEPGVSVEVSIESWGEGTSAADGTFTITGLDAGPFDLSARRDEFDGWKTEKPIAAGTKDVVITMAANPWLHGQVVDAVTGAPVTSFTFAVGRMIEPNGGAFMRKGWKVDDPSGKFASNEAPAGRWFVRVLAPGYAPCDAGPFAVPPPQDQPVEVRLSRGTRVTGSIRSESSQLPLAGVKLRLAAAQGNSKVSSTNRELVFEPRAVSDDRGRFVFDHVAEGTYDLAPLTGRYVARQRAQFELPPGHEAVDLPVLDLCRSGWITGNARDARKKSRGLYNVVVMAECGKVRKIGITGADGRYRIAPLPFGEYSVRIVRFEEPKEGTAPPAEPSKTVSVFEGQESVVDLE